MSYNQLISLLQGCISTLKGKKNSWIHHSNTKTDKKLWLFGTLTMFHSPKHNQLVCESLKGLQISPSACRWHFLKDCMVTRTGIITHFHASILPSIKCHSIFSLLLLCLSCTLSPLHCLSHFAQSLCSLHFPCICFYLPALSFPSPYSPHSQYPHPVFLYVLVLSLSFFCFTWFYSKWYLV